MGLLMVLVGLGLITIILKLAMDVHRTIEERQSAHTQRWEALTASEDEAHLADISGEDDDEPKTSTWNYGDTPHWRAPPPWGDGMDPGVHYGTGTRFRDED